MAASSRQSKTLTPQEKDAVLDQLKTVLSEDGLKPKTDSLPPMSKTTHYLDAIDRYSSHLDAMGIDSNALMLELLYRQDGKGDGKPCGGGWISKRKKCSKKGAQKLAAALKAGDKGAIARVRAGKKKAADRQALSRAVAADKGKKARDIPGKKKAAKPSALKEGDRFKMPPTTKEKAEYAKKAQNGVRYMQARVENMTTDNVEKSFELLRKKYNSRAFNDAVSYAVDGKVRERVRDQIDEVWKKGVEKAEALRTEAREKAAERRARENRESLNRERERKRQMRNKYGMG